MDKMPSPVRSAGAIELLFEKSSGLNCLLLIFGIAYLAIGLICNARCGKQAA